MPRFASHCAIAEFAMTFSETSFFGHLAEPLVENGGVNMLTTGALISGPMPDERHFSTLR